MGRRGTGLHLTPLQVALTCPPPGSDAHRAYFGCPIRFGAPHNALILNAEDLDKPFPGHNPELLEILTPALSAAMGELQAHRSTSEQVKTVLKRSLASGRPELSDVARELGMSERTLPQCITNESATFRELMVAVRQELGRQMLADPTTAIDEVAYLLGYQDTSSCYRAFREWEGVTPSRWRKLNCPAEPSSPTSAHRMH